MRATPTRRDELAQHSENVWYARGGKSGGSAVEQRAITWLDLALWATTGLREDQQPARHSPELLWILCGITEVVAASLILVRTRVARIQENLTPFRADH
jgi:hypothetical protein